MSTRPRLVLFVALVAALLLAWLWFWDGAAGQEPVAPSAPQRGTDHPAAAAANLGALAGTGDPAQAELARGAGSPTPPPTGVRGIVVDLRTGAPLGGVEVVAVADEPGFEPLVARFRGLFREGMYTETRAPRRELGRTVSAADGHFELLDLPPGRVFLDGRSDAWFVRTPGTARLAPGEVQSGIELRASPGGRVRGIVLGPDGGPAPHAQVQLRPGLNAFFGQLTERQYRWLETTADAQGRFDLPGVPPGQGYTASASAAGMALEEQFGVAVAVGEVTEVTLRGHAGATVAGRVLDAAGEPIAGAAVAMVYLDISRVLFSADGRSAPLVTDERGQFRLEHIAAGRVAFVAAAADLAPSQIEELAVVDGGRYEDLVLQLDTGATLRGRVVDDLGQPVAGAALELRPFERPNDPQFLKMMLKIRRVATTSDLDGSFTARGLSGERLVVQAQKPGFATTMRFGVRLDEPDLVIELQRGAVVRGRVEQDGAPLPRFRVETRTRPIPPPGEPTAAANGRSRRTTDGTSAPTWAGDGGVRMRMGPNAEPPTGTLHLPEGQTMLDRGLDGNWREVAAADGRFELRGVPPGRVRVRVRADGQQDASEQELDLQPGQTSDELVFALAPGLAVQGTVVDDATGQPIADAQVTAYPARSAAARGNGLFAVNLDPEDFDFLALAAATGRRSALTDSKGRFHIDGLGAGTFRLTARHPDRAKASAKDVVLASGEPPPAVEIRLGSGGGVEGLVTGRLQRPLADAMVVAFSLQTGTVRSSTTDQAGHYAIDGLPPGQYLVFKSRLDERADNIPLELLSNMRLKATTVKAGARTRVDVHDESDDGVRVFGTVREGTAPVPRALVTLLGSDRDGILGMGVRSGAANLDGRYELTGIRPGSYVMQVTRFLGQPVQTTFEFEVPDDTGGELLFDIVLPTSEIAGMVVDTRGQPVPNVRVSLASEQGRAAGADGLLGLIAQGGFAQARSDAQGNFRLRAVAAGTYRLTAGARRGDRRATASDATHGEGRLSGIVVDGTSKLESLVVTVPLAGRIQGQVLDGSGHPVAGAEIACVATGATLAKGSSNPLLEMLRAGSRAIRTDDAGRFEIGGLTPGRYDLRVDSEALEAGKALDVEVVEDGTASVTLRMVRGARLRVRATNVDRQRIPLAQISLLDGQGKAVISRVSTLSVMKRFLAQKDEVADSGWYEFGSVPPDTYTAVIAEQGKPELRIVRTIADGETVEWDVDVGAELAARERQTPR